MICFLFINLNATCKKKIIKNNRRLLNNKCNNSNPLPSGSLLPFRIYCYEQLLANTIFLYMYVIAIADCLISLHARSQTWCESPAARDYLMGWLPFADVNSLSARARERELEKSQHG